MPLKYDIPPNPGPLAQGELLRDIWEHRPRQAPIGFPEGFGFHINSIHHSLMIVMTAACDLEQDYRARFPDGLAEGPYVPTTLCENNPTLVPHVLLCEAYLEGEIRSRIKGSDIWKRIRQNQDERYHHFESAPIGDSYGAAFPDLYLDFKKTLALPTSNMYDGLRTGGVKRVAVVPAVHVHDLIHRYYGFLSRVGLPD